MPLGNQGKGCIQEKIQGAYNYASPLGVTLSVVTASISAFGPTDGLISHGTRLIGALLTLSSIANGLSSNKPDFILLREQVNRLFCSSVKLYVMSASQESIL